MKHAYKITINAKSFNFHASFLRGECVNIYIASVALFTALPLIEKMVGKYRNFRSINQWTNSRVENFYTTLRNIFIWNFYAVEQNLEKWGKVSSIYF